VKKWFLKKEKLPQLTVGLSTFIVAFFFISVKPAEANILIEALVGSLGVIIVSITNFLLKLCLALLWIAAFVLDQVVMWYVVEMRARINSMPAIYTLWSTFRDLANMLFIFILLYAGITTILGIFKHDTKRVVATVIIMAVLINFSFFITGLVIDVANILALQFYYSTNIVGLSEENYEQGIGFAFVSILNVTSWQTIQGAFADPGPIIFSQVMGIIFVLISTFVFFTAALMLLIRFAVLLFLLIVSPLAFAARALPSLTTSI
jgi:hypothetical protein